MAIIIGVGVFVTLVLFINAIFQGFKTIQNSESRKIRNRLRMLSAADDRIKEIDIVRKRFLSEIPWLHTLLVSFARIHKIDRLLVQANTGMPLGFFLLLSLFLAAAGYTCGLALRINQVIVIAFSFLLAATPFFYLLSKRERRMKKFQEQLPDALDLVARALKAGHALSGGMRMVAEEFPDPVGTEFNKTLNEIGFGVGVDEALKNLAKRVSCADLQFFVVSVIVQRETGGNLAEILERIANLIRERFKLQGKIRTLSAEGRFSAVILIVLPIIISIALLVLNPQYIGTLVNDPIGHVLIAVAILLMITGVIVMKRMVTIKV